MSDCMGKYL